jgi:hypothetical protein
MKCRFGLTYLYDRLPPCLHYWKVGDPFCTIPPSRNRHTNIDLKFKTHFASTSYRVQNTHTYRQYSLFNYILISLKNTKNLSSFALIQHNMTIYYNVVRICLLHSHHTGEHMVHGPFHLGLFWASDCSTGGATLALGWPRWMAKMVQP